MDGQHNASATTVGDARRAQIVHAARAICLEKGFSKITISDIAGRVGMTRSLFYHYFQDKDQVADAVARRRHRRSHLAIGGVERQSRSRQHLESTRRRGAG